MNSIDTKHYSAIIQTMKLTVFIPAYNEAESIESTVQNIKKVFRSDKYLKKVFSKKEIVVLDDNSTDNTVEICKKLRGVTVYENKGISKGVGRNLRISLNHLYERRADITVGIDADGQFDPSDLPRLIEPIIDGTADMVTGTKFSDRNNPPVGLNWKKLYGNYLVVFIINFILGANFTDVSCGYRAYNRKALYSLKIWGNRTYVQEAFVDLFFKGIDIAEVPIEAVYEGIRPSKVFRFKGGIIWYGFRTLNIIIRSLRDYKSFEFFGSLSLISFFASILPAVILIFHYWKSGSFSPYIFLGFISGGLVGFSVLMMIVTLLADMISRLRLNQEAEVIRRRFETFAKGKK